MYPQQNFGCGSGGFWLNCDLLYNHLTKSSSSFSHFLGSREAAFVYAISSAGVVYALTRACSQGELKSCNCDPHKRGREKDERGEFDWGGCSDNISYGINFAKAFIDAKEKTGRDARALMNLHNNRCGRTVRSGMLYQQYNFSVVANANVDIKKKHDRIHLISFIVYEVFKWSLPLLQTGWKLKLHSVGCMCVFERKSERKIKRGK